MPDLIEKGFHANQILGSGALKPYITEPSSGYGDLIAIEPIESKHQFDFDVGSGGGLLQGYLTLSPSTGGEVLVIGTFAPVLARSNVNSIIEKLLAIKSWLGLNISQLSNVCLVKRPTIYNWLADGAVRQRNQKRIGEIYDFAQEWNSLCDLPLGDHLTQPVVNDSSLLDLLSEEEIGDVTISFALAKLRDAAIEGHESAKAFSLAERLRTLGFSENSADDRGVALDQISPKSTGPGE